MKAREIMTMEVVSVSPDASILEAVRLMLQNRISGLPVVDRRFPTLLWDSWQLVIVCRGRFLGRGRYLA